eukprot:46442_1
MTFLYIQFNDKLIERNRDNVTIWTNTFQLFLNIIYWRREFRVNKYVDINTEKYIEYAEAEIDRLKESAESTLNSIKDRMEICPFVCAFCFYPCLQCKGHETYEDWSSTHSCYQTKLNSSGRHQCSGACDYCDIPRCADDSGHKGKHNCRETIPIHTCGKSCCLCDYPGCMKKCNEDPDHDPNIEHKCNGVHFCKQRCPVQNCPKTCKIKYQHGEEHKEHICNETKCSSKCQVKIWDKDTQTEIECGKDCVCGDHRHILDDMANKKQKDKVHWCGSKHSCPKKCSKPGNCFVGIERSFEETETYITSSGIKIEYKPFANAKEGRKRCSKKIEVGKFEHDSGHECAVSKHTCTEKCDSCGYFCMKEYGDNHGLEHETVHGNMRNTIYYAPDFDPDEKIPSPNLLEEQKSKVNNKDEDVSIAAMYRAGDLGKAELCNVFCSRLGRGHIHLELCGKYDHEKDKVRHETRQYKPNANQPKDEIKHSTYWKKKGWADPCTSVKKVNFDKCNFQCTHPSHQETEMNTKEIDHTKYCTKELWHENCVTPSGHEFTCDHPFKNAHVVFICDTSGSMMGHDRLTSIPSYDWIATDSKLNNRLGALYSAIHDFVDIRWENARRDTFTAILY